MTQRNGVMSLILKIDVGTALKNVIARELYVVIGLG